MSLPVGGWHVDSAPTKFFLVDILSDVLRREQPEHSLSGRVFLPHIYPNCSQTFANSIGT